MFMQQKVGNCTIQNIKRTLWAPAKIYVSGASPKTDLHCEEKAPVK